MHTKWESLVILAREVDRECAAGRFPDGSKAARLARMLLEFHAHLSPGVRPSDACKPTNGTGDG